MKFTKMSLVAALLIGSSAFAIENTKVSGDAKLYYSTQDDDNNDLFSRDSAIGQAAINLSITTDLVENVSAGVSTTALTTLGLENNLVSGVWAGANNGTDTSWWVSEAWMAASMGKTTAKIGRQKLDTPFAFTETWNTAENTFDAAVLLNQDLPDTTLVGAWVGKGNGTAGTVVNAPTDAKSDQFQTFAIKGAYAAAVVNNSWKPLTVQAWYYDVVDAAHAVWLQGDLAMENGLIAGVQYAMMDTTGVLDAAEDSSAVAAKIGYTNANMGLTVSAAFSQTDKTGALDVSNVATGHTVGSQSKLYTEAWWNYGYVGAPDMTAINFTAEYAVKDIVDLGLYVTSVDAGTEANTGNADAKHADMQEITLSASKSFGPLDTSLVYCNVDADDQNDGDAYNIIQAYLTLNF